MFKNLLLIIILLFLFYQFNSFRLVEILNNTKLIAPLVNYFEDKLYFISGNEEKNIILSAFGSKNITKNEFLPINQSKNIEAVFGGENSEYLLAFYGNLLQIYKENNLSEFSFNNTYDVLRDTLKKLKSSFFYISSNYEITKMELNLKNISNISIISRKSLNFSEKIQNIASVSCDYSRNEQYYICSYFYNLNNFGISVFSNELKLLNNYKYDTSVTNSSNYFNKIVYLKDINKFISLNSESDTTVRIRYFEIYNGKLKNILNIKNANKGYIDIAGTQYNPYIDNNDIVSFESDKIIKIFSNETNILLFSKIQLYESDTILTVKTTKMEFGQDNILTNPRLLIWRNSLIVAVSTTDIYSSYYKESFFSLGYPEAIDDFEVTDNNNIKLPKPKLDYNFFSLKIFYQILSIPEGFKFANSLNNKPITNGSYFDPEIDELSIIQYQKKVDAQIDYQTVSIGQFYNLTFEIFPKGAKIPAESIVKSRGDYGQFYLYIFFCNNGYYKIEDDNNETCSKVPPEGFYLNKEYGDTSFKKCHPSCSECITGSDNDSNMKCLSCAKNYEYDEISFNCYPKYKEVIKEVNIKGKINKFFWAFLFISLLAILFAFFIIWNDKIIKPKTISNNIEEQKSLIEQRNEQGNLEMK